MKVLIVASEAIPFIKTGGLADVAGALPKELHKLGAEVAVMLPLHSKIKHKYKDDLQFIASATIKLGWREKYLGVMKIESSGIPFYFIDCDDYFGDETYRGGDAENEQYLYFCRAVLAAIPMTGFVPDVIHCNDWHTGMIPMLLRTQYSGTELDSVHSVITIHNINFQGKMDFQMMQDILDIDAKYNGPGGVEAGGCANMLKAGLVFADKITTVSSTYAREILTPWFGMGLEGTLKAREHDLCGILNGLDYEDFDPMTDKALIKNYDSETITAKRDNKKELRSRFGLVGNLYDPVMCMVTRLTSQKGLDLVRHVLEELLKENMHFVLLGSGDAEYEDFFRYIAEKYPGKAGVHLGYDEELARIIYAGTDFLLMPSQFEPCGLSQMIAQRYGALPIVRETGGLADTVTSWNEFNREGNGFSFWAYNAHDMMHAIRYALSVYRDKPALRQLRKNAMLLDNSFLASAKKYMELYSEVIG